MTVCSRTAADLQMKTSAPQQRNSAADRQPYLCFSFTLKSPFKNVTAKKMTPNFGFTLIFRLLNILYPDVKFLYAFIVLERLGEYI